MPSLGADMEAGTLVEWLVKPGDRVKRGDIIAVVETQKGAIEIETFESGTVEKLLVGLDTKVPVGTPLALIGGAGTPIAPFAYLEPRYDEVLRNVVLASAAIPGAFSPVMIDVEVKGKAYQKTQLDGDAPKAQ